MDSMKFKWRNCAFAEKWQYHGPKGGKLEKIVLEAWCDRNLYIWSWLAVRAVTNNSLHVLSL